MDGHGLCVSIPDGNVTGDMDLRLTVVQHAGFIDPVPAPASGECLLQATPPGLAALLEKPD